jgi:uncharacterized protein YecE (DUF72 family)
MTRIRIACAGYRGHLSAYWRDLDALEMSDDQSRAKAATHARWREAAPKDVRFVPRLPAEIALTDFHGPVAEAWWTRCLQVVERLGADTVLFRTGPDFRPTAENRRALVSFFGPRRRAGLSVAWRAEGLWDGQPEDRNGVCVEAGLVPVVDPLGIDPDDRDAELPAGEHVYWRLLGRPGGGTRFSESDLQDVLALLADRTSGYVVFGAGWMTGDARRLRSLLDVNAGADGGADAFDLGAP